MPLEPGVAAVLWVVAGFAFAVAILAVWLVLQPFRRRQPPVP